MKVVILAGGYGTRISEESHLRPKPMIEIGEKPILWHIMKGYSHYGFNDFVICLGYKGNVIKDYFANYFLYGSDVTFDMRHGNNMVINNHSVEQWKVTLVNTGLDTMTGGRVKRVKEYLGNETFMLTYGDGVGNVDISKLLEFHKGHGKLVTVTAVHPSGRYGMLDMGENSQVLEFVEKPKSTDAWVNGGFFVMEPKALDYIQSDYTSLEKEPLESLAHDGEIVAYKHTGFWHAMDTQRDKQYLENIWQSQNAPWKIW